MRFVLLVACSFVVFCVSCRTVQRKCHELCDVIDQVVEEREFPAEEE